MRAWIGLKSLLVDDRYIVVDLPNWSVFETFIVMAAIVG